MSSSTVLQDAAQYHAAIYVNCVAGTALLLYDLVTRMDDEFELIWRSSNTPPKFLYVTSRYFGLVVQLIDLAEVFPTNCPHHSYFRTVFYFILHISVELSLMIRIYALWGHERKVAIFLGMSWLSEQTTNVVMSSIAITRIAKSAVPYPAHWPFRGCTITDFPTFFNFCWLPMLLFETVLFLMSAYKCLSFRPLIRTPLIICIFRDGTVYYFLMSFVFVIRIIAQLIPGTICGSIVDTWMIAIFSITGSHLMLRIRKLAAARNQANLVTPCISVSIPEFASRPPDNHHGHDRNCNTVSSSRSSKPPSDGYEMHPLTNHTSVRVVPIQADAARTDCPPKLSLDLPLTHLTRARAERGWKTSLHTDGSQKSPCTGSLSSSWLDEWSVRCN
ncbi:hypothetical protein BXZ70DRAFT_934762 [Cristinia sonorae]|uniref:DUF6533 domain-containing protein n=1 Tax=Cristinia sonorae TaxID=1940300 RepID=A0A8K0URP0_9AGAR|nr:hypothetical protein BXZ70DRAFT_934762 [Cristinia sonorae]